MTNNCLNMVGGDCISALHMFIFIIVMMILGFIAGWFARELILTRPRK